MHDQFKMGGLGEEIYSQAGEDYYHEISLRDLINWVHSIEEGSKLIKVLVSIFEEVELLENYGGYYKLRVTNKSKSIGYLFGLIEANRDLCGLTEYSVGQTTLEQIF